MDFWTQSQGSRGQTRSILCKKVGEGSDFGSLKGTYDRFKTQTSSSQSIDGEDIDLIHEDE